MRRETAVEAHHKVKSRVSERRLDPVNLADGQTKRLLDKDMFAGEERLFRELRMAFVPCRNHDRVHVIVLQHCGDVAGNL